MPARHARPLRRLAPATTELRRPRRSRAEQSNTLGRRSATGSMLKLFRRLERGREPRARDRPVPHRSAASRTRPPLGGRARVPAPAAASRSTLARRCRGTSPTRATPGRYTLDELRALLRAGARARGPRRRRPRRAAAGRAGRRTSCRPRRRELDRRLPRVAPRCSAGARRAAPRARRGDRRSGVRAGAVHARSTSARCTSRCATLTGRSLRRLRGAASAGVPRGSTRIASAIDERRSRRVRGLLDRPAASAASRIRTHGDYHLGQVLSTGQATSSSSTSRASPAGRSAERRLKRSPLRDVAGMLRSFHYAAYAALFARERPRRRASAARPRSGPSSGGRWARAPSCGAYRAAVAPAALVPADDPSSRRLLDLYLLEKAVYELGYELNNRPDWVVIPARGLRGAARRVTSRGCGSRRTARAGGGRPGCSAPTRTRAAAGTRRPAAALTAALRALGHDVAESGAGAAEAPARPSPPSGCGRPSSRWPWRGARRRPGYPSRRRRGQTGCGGRWRSRTAARSPGRSASRSCRAPRRDARLSCPPCRTATTAPHVEVGGRAAATLVLAAPRRRLRRAAAVVGRVPPALRRARRPFGPGDFTRMRRLLAWTAGLGGDLVGTMPLLAAFLDQPFEPSPYVPVSRLFWNELYIDPRGRARSAPRRRAPAQLIAASAVPGDDRLIDYRAAMAAKRRVLEALARRPSRPPAARRLERHLREHPDLGELRRVPRPLRAARAAAWRDCGEPPAAADPAAAALPRLRAVAAAPSSSRAVGRRRGRGLYLDLPLGVHPGGYDTWRHRDALRRGRLGRRAARRLLPRRPGLGLPAAAPGRPAPQRPRLPDRVHPRATSASRGGLRIDHVMGLHRAVLDPARPRRRPTASTCATRPRSCTPCSASSRTGTAPASSARTSAPCRTRSGADHVGARPPAHVRAPDPARHRRGSIRPGAPAAMVGINTHDMPTFAGLLGCRHRRRRAPRDAARRGRPPRACGLADGPQVLDADACSASWPPPTPGALLVNLEDLWWRARAAERPRDDHRASQLAPAGAPRRRGPRRACPASPPAMRRIADLRRGGR